MPYKSIRESFTHQCAVILSCYRKHCSNQSPAGQLILPESLKLLPMYANCLLKSDCLLSRELLPAVFVNSKYTCVCVCTAPLVSLDLKCWYMHLVLSLPTALVGPFLYPRVYALVRHFSNLTLTCENDMFYIAWMLPARCECWWQGTSPSLTLYRSKTVWVRCVCGREWPHDCALAGAGHPKQHSQSATGSGLTGSSQYWHCECMCACVRACAYVHLYPLCSTFCLLWRVLSRSEWEESLLKFRALVDTTWRYLHPPLWWCMMCDSPTQLVICKQRDKTEVAFRRLLKEDKGAGQWEGTSYIDFLCNIHREIKEILS